MAYRRSKTCAVYYFVSAGYANLRFVPNHRLQDLVPCLEATCTTSGIEGIEENNKTSPHIRITEHYVMMTSKFSGFQVGKCSSIQDIQFPDAFCFYIYIYIYIYTYI